MEHLPIQLLSFGFVFLKDDVDVVRVEGSLSGALGLSLVELELELVKLRPLGHLFSLALPHELVLHGPRLVLVGGYLLLFLQVVLVVLLDEAVSLPAFVELVLQDLILVVLASSSHVLVEVLKLISVGGHSHVVSLFVLPVLLVDLKLALFVNNLAQLSQLVSLLDLLVQLVLVGQLLHLVHLS